MWDESQNITRKRFLKTSLAIAGVGLGGFSSFVSSRGKNIPAIGLCGSWESSAMAQQAGCSYIEEGVAKILMPTKSDSEFRKQFELLSSTQPLKVRSFIVFIPGEMPLVGDHANHEEVIKYAAIAFQRAQLIGATTIVLGSGRARKIPDGFEKAKAKEQFVSICALMASLAAKSNLTIAVEQLNQSETNFINTLQEAAEIVEAVQHPNLKMMCDIYHALRENDAASEIIKYKQHLVHCHIAEKNERTPPGTKGDDFTPYFKALKKINYSGGISLECRWSNLEAEIVKAVAVVKEQYANA